MTIQLNLPSDIEAELKELSRGSKQAMQTYIIEAVKQQLQQLRAHNADHEVNLLKKINIGFPEYFWLQYNTLVQKKAQKDINAAELSELIEMTRQIEAANAERLEAALQLSLLRNRNPKELMREMGILQER